MVKAKYFTVAKIFEGEIDPSDLTLEHEELPPLQDGDYLVEAHYLSVDPYMRAYANSYKIGQVMIGVQVGKVIESKNPNFPQGSTVVGHLGWRTHTVVRETDNYHVYIFPDIQNLPLSLSLGVLGLPGNSAYFGLLDICQPVEGDTVVVTGAGGAVGSHVGQIAKIKGCRVVGFAGSEQKVEWLKTLGFDEVINYKTTPDLAEELKRAAPDGVDCYFDNVGGEISSIILSQMNRGGRVAVCGSISSYNAETPVTATIIQPAIVKNELLLKGFHVHQYRDRWFESIEQNLQWIKEGRLKYRETITDGFENALDALAGVMKGKNIGKAVVTVKANLIQDEPFDFAKVLHKFKSFDV